MDREEAMHLMAKADAVCFDVDSTLILDEGIDVLAASCGVGEKVAAWTRKAMGGGVTFEEALKSRLDIIKPTRQQLEQCLANHPPRLTPGATNLIEKLHQHGKTVYLVSGGFRQMIYPIADLLGIPHSQVYANNLLFNEEGEFLGHHEKEMTARSGGKTRTVNYLIVQKGHTGIVMIGDGVTDMEAKPPALLFIGFGGNVIREKVKKGADIFAMNMQEII
eukprot:Ihof_evm8s78 gene=Ihof_evmTU8s78